MGFKSLLEPVTEQGIKNTNFFEGRLLSAKDLRQQTEATRDYDRKLGKVAGAGVVHGLDVTTENQGEDGNNPVVRVSKGKAINLDGDILDLSIDYVDIQLSRIIKSPNPDTVFSDCEKAISQSLRPSGAGLYVLVMSPVSKYQGYAPKSGLQAQGVANDCGRANVIDGVQFRLVQFHPLAMPEVSADTKLMLQDELFNNLSPVGAGDVVRLSKLQNAVAHICFGTESSKRSQTDILKTVSDEPVGFDALIGQQEGLDTCDVPLALVYWTFDGIGFLDNWSVKRQAYPYTSADKNVNYNSKRSRIVFESMLFQFQNQVEKILVEDLTTTEALTFNAVDYFQYLPPAGLLPLFKSGSASKGVLHENFFSRQPHRPPEYVSDSQAREIIYSSASYAPIETQEREMIWLYRTWQRDFQEDSGDSSISHLIFTCGHTPHQAKAKFDLSRWNYSHYTRI